MKFLLLVIGMLAVFSSCTNSTKNGIEKEFDSGAIFYDYKVQGEEGGDSVTVLLQYRFGNYEGSPMLLDSGSKVALDGREIKADSAKLTGVFYEIMLPAEEFKGTHEILFTDKKGKSHSQEFSFNPFSLATELPSQIKKKPFTIQLSSFDKEPTAVHLIMIDTAFNTPDVNEELIIENGELTITDKMWRALKAGPVTMEIYREEETPLEKDPKLNGRIVKTYVLKREFEVVED
jgi:hypothetical protein